jgi:diacylglycerol kinase family enzyme
MEGSGVWNTLRYGAALLRGRLHRLDDVQILTGDKVRVEGNFGESVQMDGDLMGPPAGTLPLEVSVDETPVTLVGSARR